MHTQSTSAGFWRTATWRFEAPSALNGKLSMSGTSRFDSSSS
jgi:hypothetical protein